MNYPILTKKYHFCASHKYGNAYWSEQKNLEVFGKDYNNHGHNYVLEVSIKGPINPETGWLIDLGELNEIVKSNVVDILDHSQIEEDIEWFKTRQPSTENLVIFIWEQINSHINGEMKLHKIKLRETPTIYTEYYGPENE